MKLYLYNPTHFIASYGNNKRVQSVSLVMASETNIVAEEPVVKDLAVLETQLVRNISLTLLTVSHAFTRACQGERCKRGPNIIVHRYKNPH